ncbi:cation:dicarboxylate symporter family transporter [Arthrobacter sp. GAS37]|uniref:cation:dicarboxylate symporter family transporter n=1 Tax=Arthrobacter sp. GAS37 TaxID=3156261 RepID=UPI00384E95F2
MALTATLATIGTIPAAGIMLIFGIDKFMSECRALVNFTGNAVATLFIAWWDRTLDADRVRRVFAGEVVEPIPVSEVPAPAAAVEPFQPADRRPAYSESI